MARDLGHGLAAATDSLGSRLVAGLADQPTPAPAAASQEAGASTTAAASQAGQTSRELYDTQVHTWNILSFQWISLLLLA